MSVVSSPLAVAGIIGIVLGLVLSVSGIVSLISNQQQPGTWYVWLLLISGLVLGVAGGVMLAIALSKVYVHPSIVLGQTSEQAQVATYQEPVNPINLEFQYNKNPAQVAYQSPSQVGYQPQAQVAYQPEAQVAYQTPSQVGYQPQAQVGYQAPDYVRTTSPVNVELEYNRTPTIAQVGYQAQSAPPPRLVHEGKTPISTTIQVSSARSPSVSYQ